MCVIFFILWAIDFDFWSDGYAIGEYKVNIGVDLMNHDSSRTW